MLNQKSSDTEKQTDTDYVASQGPNFGCPSAKYFVHPRVAFSVRGKIKHLKT